MFSIFRFSLHSRSGHNKAYGLAILLLLGLASLAYAIPIEARAETQQSDMPQGPHRVGLVERTSPPPQDLVALIVFGSYEFVQPKQPLPANAQIPHGLKFLDVPKLVKDFWAAANIGFSGYIGAKRPKPLVNERWVMEVLLFSEEGELVLEGRIWPDWKHFHYPVDHWDALPSGILYKVDSPQKGTEDACIVVAKGQLLSNHDQLCHLMSELAY
ncbi:hypothetical protein EV361DRAFT_1037484 [Lentinula raphanica]|uniref:Uncharacterized protein n=1 Tax=Lentinula raphanica TaxID=153919 RepID=A0AA38P2S5_9AGAR|nr:hypothetical protein F5878DRAFT_712263 [Lentinula raphanica]KAJ3965423.1 hypothetical protein EV361DRAFT_1037484 [Lentinula raphanica]